MIIHDIQQGTLEWQRARIGIPTASKFDQILTPGGEPSKSWERYAHEILAEEMLGHPLDTFQSAAMLEGTERENESVAYYEFQREVETAKVGFVTDDARTMGCSPDRFVGDDGLLETKNPLAHTHVGYLINGKVGKEYWPQVQGALLVTGRNWIDVMSYFPGLPPQIIRVERDENYIALLTSAIRSFNQKLALKRIALIERGLLMKKLAS